VNFAVAAAVFPVILLGELPDKTMFASLMLAARGRPLSVWVGAAAAFTVHVAIAVAAGRLLALAPRRPVDAVVAALFVGGAIYALRAGPEEEQRAAAEELDQLRSRRRVVLTAFLVIFLAEWGDLTQVLIADLAARYRDPIAVAVGALAALWVTAGLAAAGSRLLRRLPLRPVRWVTAAVLLVFAGFAAAAAA
jgi:putative Ca2+/H+ antiporter (TMEM165/GDT1 family)